MSNQSNRVISDSEFPGSSLRHTARLFKPSAADRMAARLHPGALDRALAAGADPSASPQIAARAAQLGSTLTRARIAEGLERLALSADKPQSRLRILPSRAATLVNRSDMLELADILRRDRPLYAAGIAMLKILLADGTGPAFTDQHGDTLARHLHVARAALGVRTPWRTHPHGPPPFASRREP
jgi:hypothetical protein